MHRPCSVQVSRKSSSFFVKTNTDCPRVQKFVDDMEPIYDEMAVLIVPSLWQEAWGLVATEAQIRGIPVIAANIGGLAEAKRYQTPLLEVNEITGTERDVIGEYIVPAQDAAPWVKQLDRLLTSQSRYEEVAEESYLATARWLKEFPVRRFEEELLRIMK